MNKTEELSKVFSNLGIISNFIVKKQDESIKLQNRNLVLFSQISDNIYNLAGKLGASLTSLDEVKKYVVFDTKDAVAEPLQQEQQAVAVDKQGKETSKKSNNLLLMTSLYGALLYGVSIIDKVLDFFKDPIGILSSMLGSIGEEIVNFFQEGSAFRDFITEAFNSAKNELMQTFDDLKDIFKFIVADPLVNLFDDIKVFFVDLAIKGVKNLPDWLKGDSIKAFEKSLENTKQSLKEQKESKIAEQQRREDFEKKIDYREAVKQAKEEEKVPKVEDLKKDQPKSGPSVPTPTQTIPQETKISEPVVQTQEPAKEQKKELHKVQDVSTSAESVSKPSPTASEPVGKQGMLGLLQKAFEDVGITNPLVRAALLANIEKESSFKPKDENLNYSSVDRIKKVFPTAVRVARLSDEDLKQYTNNPEGLAELVYGSKSPVGKLMGNNEPGDGYKYRGRGFIQITGKKNYAYFSKLIGVDLIKNPELANDPIIAAKIAALFVKQGLKGRMDFKTQSEANRAVTQVIGGAGLDLSKGIGAEILAKVDKYSSQYADTGSSGTMVANASTSGQSTSTSSAEINAAKKQQNSQVVLNINNSSSTAVKVGAPQESSTTIARPVS